MTQTRHLLFALLLFAALPANAAPPDSMALQIDAVRLGVMMEQSQSLLETLEPHAPEPVTPQQVRAHVFDSLVAAVLSYNLAAHEACQSGRLAGRLCTAPYLPRWLGDKPARYDDAQLHRMIDEVSARLTPFWEAVCAKARAAGSQEPVCPME